MGDEQLAQRLQASAPRRPQPEDFIRGDRLVGVATLDAGDALDAARDLVRAGATEERARAGLAVGS